jgi:class 3 adenylate cyclase
MERDEPGTHERVQVLRKQLIEPLIDEHRGHIVKLTGDGRWSRRRRPPRLLALGAIDRKVDKLGACTH